MKLSKIIIIGIRSIIIIFFVLVQIVAITTILPMMASISELIGALVVVAAEGTLLYYLLFKCKYKLIKKLVLKC